jgi:maleamate amidohydrolase
MPGSEDLRLPDEIREALYGHLEELRRGFESRGQGGRVGFGERPAVIVIDLALGWTDPKFAMGTDLESVVDATCKVLDAAREADVPIFFTTMAREEDDPTNPSDLKRTDVGMMQELGSESTVLDPRLGRRPTEKFIVKKYASCFKGTDLHEMLASLRVDTLIVTGCSTSHCVYATCREAASSFRLIVPEEAVGERCELFHLVNLLDIDLGLGDVMPVDEVTGYLGQIKSARPVGSVG